MVLSSDSFTAISAFLTVPMIRHIIFEVLMRTRIDAYVARFIAASVLINISGGNDSCMILILADPDK